MDGTFISIPCWSRQHVTLTWRTGPIFVCPRIHPWGSKSWSCLSFNPSFKSWIVREYCPMETFLIQLVHKSETLLSHSITFRISVRDHAVDLLLLEHSSQLFVPTYSPLQAPIYDITAQPTNPRLLRRYWADLQNWSCEIKALHSKGHHWSESYISLLSFSRIPIQRCFRNWRPFFCFTRTEKRPLSQRKFLCVISYRFRIRKHSLHFQLFVQSTSLNMDMKMIRSSNSSGLVLRVVMLTWISLYRVFWWNFTLELKWFSVDFK